VFCLECVSVCESVCVTGVVNRAWVNAAAMHSLRTVDASDVPLEEAPDAGILPALESR